MQTEQKTCLDYFYENKGFCFSPFNYIYINAAGYVFPCCYSQQFKHVSMGNVNEEHILDIINGPKARELRKNAVESKLACNINTINPNQQDSVPYCTRACKKHNPTELGFADIIGEWSPKQISYLQLELGFFCNSRCAMCGQPHDDRRHLPYEQLKDLIIASEPLSVGLQGGEVYYIPGAKDFMLWLKDNKKDAWIMNHTNGNIPLDFAEDFIALYDHTELSTYGASPATHQAVTGMKFEKTWDFMDKIVEIRNSNPDYSKKIIGSKMTIIPTAFHEIPEMCILAEEKKMDYVAFSFDAFVMKSFVPRYDNEFTQRVWKRLNKVLDNLTIPYDCTKLKMLGFKRDNGIYTTRSEEDYDNTKVEQPPENNKSHKYILPIDFEKFSTELTEEMYNLCNERGNSLYANYFKALLTPQKAAKKFLLEKIIKENSDFAEAHYSLGEIMEKTEKTEEAEQCYKKALEIKPEWKLAKEKLSIINSK